MIFICVHNGKDWWSWIIHHTQRYEKRKCVFGESANHLSRNKTFFDKVVKTKNLQNRSQYISISRIGLVVISFCRRYNQKNCHGVVKLPYRNTTLTMKNNGEELSLRHCSFIEKTLYRLNAFCFSVKPDDSKNRPCLN